VNGSDPVFVYVPNVPIIVNGTLIIVHGSVIVKPGSSIQGLNGVIIIGSPSSNLFIHYRGYRSLTDFFFHSFSTFTVHQMVSLLSMLVGWILLHSLTA
jgi:hypothetical protein